jgi:hypothetical protein
VHVGADTGVGRRPSLPSVLPRSASRPSSSSRRSPSGARPTRSPPKSAGWKRRRGRRPKRTPKPSGRRSRSWIRPGRRDRRPRRSWPTSRRASRRAIGSRPRATRRQRPSSARSRKRGGRSSEGMMAMSIARLELGQGGPPDAGGRGQDLADADIDARRALLKSARSGCRTAASAPSGAPIVSRRVSDGGAIARSRAGPLPRRGGCPDP